MVSSVEVCFIAKPQSLVPSNRIRFRVGGLCGSLFFVIDVPSRETTRDGYGEAKYLDVPRRPQHGEPDRTRDSKRREEVRVYASEQEPEVLEID